MDATPEVRLSSDLLKDALSALPVQRCDEGLELRKPSTAPTASQQRGDNDAQITERPKRMLNITSDTGRLLWILGRLAHAKRILEVGTSKGSPRSGSPTLHARQAAA